MTLLTNLTLLACMARVGARVGSSLLAPEYVGMHREGSYVLLAVKSPRVWLCCRALGVLSRTGCRCERCDAKGAMLAVTSVQHHPVHFRRSRLALLLYYRLNSPACQQPVCIMPYVPLRGPGSRLVQRVKVGRHLAFLQYLDREHTASRLPCA